MDVQRARRQRTTVVRMLVSLVVVALCASAAPNAAQETDSFDQLYSQGQRLNAAIRTLTASFTETTTSALLVRPLVTRGTLAVERPSKVVLHYQEPEARTVLIDNNRMTMTWPSPRTLDIGAAMGRVEKLFVNGTAKDLRRQFEIDDHRPSDRPGTHYVWMTPKQRRIREGLTSLELWVDRNTSLLSAMRLTFPNGDSKLMAFEHVAANAPLPADVFTLDR